MIDMLICEDKAVVLNGLKKLTESLDLPVGEIFLAQNTQQAYEIFSSRHILLVMTDIQLPDGNGLQLLQRMRSLQENFQAVIISGYDEFEYAKTAIQLGVEDYLLKPVDPNELHAALQRCIAKLFRLRDENQFFSGLLLKQLNEVWEKPLPAKGEEILLSTDNRFLHASKFAAALFCFDSAGDSGKLYRRLDTQLRRRFRQLLLLPSFGRSFFALLRLDGSDEAQIFRAFLEHTLRQLSGDGCGRLFCGISRAADDIFSLKDAALQAESALCRRFAVCREAKTAFLWEPLPSAASDSRSQAHQMCDAFCARLRLPEISAIDPGVDKLFGVLAAEPALCQLIPDCLRRMDLFLQRELAEPPALVQLLFQSDSLSQLRAQVKQKLLELCRSRLKDRAANQDAVAVAIEYMKNNYQKPLTLTLLANVVSLNYAYFSNIFKARTGVSVTAYLQNIRMAKAKELLISTNDRVREVAHKAGFSNERYFEKLFKSIEGITPSGYREKVQSFTNPQEQQE